jgi:hypothetical protein
MRTSAVISITVAATLAAVLAVVLAQFNVQIAGSSVYLMSNEDKATCVGFGGCAMVPASMAALVWKIIKKGATEYQSQPDQRPPNLRGDV